MARHAIDPDMLALQRRQIDARTRVARTIEAPKGGWIRNVRQALGMTLRQLGQRMDISPQAAGALETREQDGSISLATLTKAARALGCEVRFALVPVSSLDDVIRHQAELKARAERNRLVHTMRLESQAQGVEESLDHGKAVERWLNSRLRELWD